MALGELAAVGAVQQRQVGVDRRRRAERLEHQQLLGRVGEVVLAADDVRDLGVEVVDRDREVVEHRAVGAGDHRIVEAGVGKRGVAADHVVDDRLALVGHVQADRAVGLGLAAEAAVGAVGGLERLDVVAGRAGAIGVAGVQQLGERLAGGDRALGLEDRPLVPVEVQPAQRVEDLLDVLRRRARAVGIFDPQHERAGTAVRTVPRRVRQQPVVQRGARAADVQRAGR